MQLSTVFQISIYGFLTLSSVMLAMAEGTANPQGWTVPLALLAFFFVERKKVLQVPSPLANSLGLVAFALAAWEFLSPNIEGRLLSGAHLLVYLSWIVLFQKKTSKQYWWLCALGVLQVAVGSVLTNSGAYGTLLLFYLLFAIWTLSVFSLHQARQRFGGAERLAVVRANLIQPSGWSWYAIPASVRQNAATEASWSLRRASRSRGSIGHDPREQWVSVRFAWGTLGTATGSLLVAAVFFLLIPRYWVGKPLPSETLPGDPGRALTGFTEEVQLGDMGEILESTERVLEARLFDNDTGEPIDVEEYSARLGYDEPLFRGAALDMYRDGRWSAGRLRGGQAMITTPGPRRGMVRQEIQLQPIGTQILFAIHPVESCRLVDSIEDVRRHHVSSVLTRPKEVDAEKPLSYDAYSPKRIPMGTGLRMSSILPQFYQRFALSSYRDLPEDGLERLISLAKQAARPKTGGAKPSDREMAQRLVAYLRDSRQFSYSLDTSINDATIDPVEDFLFNRKQGHCEYYATALVLMLRAVKIPSRLISGFKGGSVNGFSEKFEVEQRHAHAWVEAYIDGQWITLDATPAAARNRIVESMTIKFRPFRDLKRFTNDSWNGYVVNISLGQQRRRIYGPLSEKITESVKALRRGDAELGAIAKSIQEFVTSPRRWFSWQGGVATFVLLWISCVLVWLARRVSAVGSRLLAGLRKRRRSIRMKVRFYERFRNICASRGLVRAATQTQREFAGEVRRSLNELLQSSGLAEFPFDLVESFYQVRFGAAYLEEKQLAEIERQLSRLERCLSGSETRGGSVAGLARHTMPTVENGPIRRRRRLIGIVLACYWLALFAGTHMPLPPRALPVGSDKLLHFAAYAGLAFLLALWVSASRVLRMKHYLRLLAIVAVYSIADELLQIPVGRTADVWDCVADWAGAVAGAAALLALRMAAARLWDSETEPAGSSKLK